jgi:ankyrin repeat protein
MMTDAWIPEIVEAVKKEGVELPESKSMKTAIHSHQLIVKESPIVTKPKAPPFEVLINAVEAGDLSKVREALQKGINPNGSVGVQNIIHFACEKGNIDIVRELLDNGAELNSRSSKWNDTPLHRACVFGHTEIVEELIKRGSTVNVRNSNCWQTPLENAITFKHFECCKLLVKAGAKINELNRNYGSTPLTEACHTGCYEIVELLLDAGANPNLSAGITPLYQAVYSPKILQLMLDRGAKPNAQNSSGSHYQASQYPIHAAASWGYDDSVCILLKAGADPKVQDGQNKTPIEIAKWQLNNHQTKPCNPQEVTAQIIQRLEKVIGLLEGKMQ